MPEGNRFKKPVAKTARNWIALFRLAHGRNPTMAELNAEQFEDEGWGRSEAWEVARANILIALKRGKEPHEQ